MSDAPSFVVPRPGPEHEVFNKDVGTWDAEIEVRHGGTTQKNRGVAVNKLACNGMWLVTDFRTESGDFEGHGVYGYDPQQKKYVGTWVDPMRTSLAKMEGTWDAEKQTMTYTGELSMPQGTMRWREVTETVDADTQVFHQMMPGPDGGEIETMTVTYRRRK
ncbi:MAG: DUF1579 domain-containing protein [Minicystis sp.]